MKPVPLMSTTVSVEPVCGEKLVIVCGSISKIKPFIVAKAFGFVTLTSPEAPGPTIAVMFVGDTKVTELASTLPKLTLVSVVKLVPVMLIIVPVGPCAGAKDVMERASAFLLISTEK